MNKSRKGREVSDYFQGDLHLLVNPGRSENEPVAEPHW